MSRIIIGETQKDFAVALRDYLTSEQHTVKVEFQGDILLECLRSGVYDLVILETALPGLDGIGVTSGYRAAGGSAPILLMAGRHSSSELQRGLDAGADAYVVKPFTLADLGAQVRALARRPSLRSETILASGRIRLDSDAGTVTRDGQVVHLRPMEYKLLQFLLKHPNQVFSPHAIFERVWRKDTSQLEDTVRTHVRTLRQKIDSDDTESVITTVRGLGYKAGNV